MSSSWGWEHRENIGGERAHGEVRGGGERGRRKEAGSRPPPYPPAELLCFPLRMAVVLHQAGPQHSHGSRGAEYAPLEEGSGEHLPLVNTSVRAAFVHVLGDLLQSLGVLAASILIYFKVLSTRPVPAFLPQLHPHPRLPRAHSLLSPLQLLAPQDPCLGSWPLSPEQGSQGPLRSCLSRTPLDLPLKGPWFPGLGVSLCLSLSARQLIPSAPSSSLSAPLGPRLPPSEMFSVSSWKVTQTPLFPILWARSDLTI